MPDLAAILEEKPKQDRALKSMGLYDEEDYGGDFVRSQIFSDFQVHEWLELQDEKAYENLEPTCFFVDGKRKIGAVLIQILL